ncbi:MAG: acetyl-CoA carboxylase biotin carboxyl carrier protein [Paenibacillaceae bacterium]
MFKLSEIKELIKLVDQTSVNELEIENEGSRLCIRKHKAEIIQVQSLPAGYVPAPVTGYTLQQNDAPHVPTSTATSATPVPIEIPNMANNLHKIVSPMVGTFYQSSSPGSPAFVSVGNQVKEKSVVCIIEAMKLMNEIEAEVKGEIVEVLVENGQLVEYGQPLYLVKTE